MSLRGATGRVWVAAMIAVVATVPTLLGWSQRACARCVAAAVEQTGAEVQSWPKPNIFKIGTTEYVIDIWCTPTVLVVCSLALLWFARLPARRFFWMLIGVLVGVTTLLTVNLIVSVLLHERGVTWTLAHYPGTIAIYAGVLLGCLAYAEVRQRRPRMTTSEGEHHDAHGTR